MPRGAQEKYGDALEDFGLVDDLNAMLIVLLGGVLADRGEVRVHH